MADKDTKSSKLEREYIVPLRRFWQAAPEYERGRKAIKGLKKFIAKHMKIPERDVEKVKLDVYLNNELWFRGRRHPPAKIKVKAIKEGDIVRIEFVEIPQHVKFLKARHEKRNKPAEEKPKEEKKPEIKKEEKTEEEKKSEQEKEKSTAIAKEAEIKQDLKAEKHTPKIEKQKTQPRRMALQK